MFTDECLELLEQIERAPDEDHDRRWRVLHFLRRETQGTVPVRRALWKRHTEPFARRDILKTEALWANSTETTPPPATEEELV